MYNNFHITEVGSLTYEELASIAADYETAMLGGNGKLTRVDEPDGTYSLLDSDGKWVGCGVSLPYDVKQGDNK